jgi:hypothetical protein
MYGFDQIIVEFYQTGTNPVTYAQLEVLRMELERLGVDISNYVFTIIQQ